jgi:precorrin-2 dehydrogenase/sirohydrochlorin ferrochelatase
MRWREMLRLRKQERVDTVFMRPEAMVTNLFPMFLKLAGKPCLVVGAGKVGEPKIEGLISTGARIQVITIDASSKVRGWAEAGTIDLDLRRFSPNDLDGKFIAMIATSSPSLNEFIYREAVRRGVLCNVVDVPEHCDFFYPAVVNRGDLQIAISTAGQSPSLAQKLRQQLERQFPPQYAAWVAQLGETRRLILASALDKERKLDLLHSLASREAFEAALLQLDERREEISARRSQQKSLALESEQV